MFEGNYGYYLLIVIIISGLGTYFTNIGLQSHKYLSSKKPDWYPEGYIFAIVWTIIYLLYSYSWTNASYYPYINGLFSINIILNFLWSFMFFYMGEWSIALGILFALNGIIAIQITSLYKYDKLASLLLIPYFLWSCFASFLNYTIIHINA